MTRVLSLVSYQVLPARSGGQRAAVLLDKCMAKHIPLICVTTKKNDVQKAEGYEVLNILSDSKLRYINIFYFFKLRKIIRDREITHIILLQPYYGWLAVLLKRGAGVKLAIRSHNIEGLRWKSIGKSWWKIMWYYERWVHRRADYNFFIQDEDLKYALENFSLQPGRCITITYGIEMDHSPSEQERLKARQFLLNKHAIPAGHTLLLFNGAFNFLPNINGLKKLLEKINPVLQKREGFEYTILICGINIPGEISAKQYPNVIFAGFVDDISVYFKGADIFLNTTTEGGGIKTKLVEALGYNMNAVSSQNGAIGIDPALCNGKMKVTEDSLEGFPEAIIEIAQVKANIPQAFFDYFNADSIAKKAVDFIK